MGARLWGAIVTSGRADVVGTRAELAVMGGLLFTEVAGGAVTAGAVEVTGTEACPGNWDACGTSASLSRPVEVAM